MMKKKLLIIGAGLTGLTIAHLLKASSAFDVIILEARNRIGGRIHTLYPEKGPSMEMGATWLGKKHAALNALLKNLYIDTFPQELGKFAIYEPLSLSPPQLVQLPPNDDPSFRIKGGTESLIHALSKNLKEDEIHLKHPVSKIEENGNHLIVSSNGVEFKADHVISTLPPFLFIKSIKVLPALPADLLAVAKCTHTWMGESIKVALSYKDPFWRKAEKSGTIFSNVGPIPEMYDHSNFEDDSYALKGFMNGNYFSVSKEERLNLIMKQLVKYFGEEAKNFISYEETVWRKEHFTFVNYDQHILPHQNNGNPIFQNVFLNGKLHVAGSETADAFPGYMEGAIRSAQFVVQKLIAQDA